MMQKSECYEDSLNAHIEYKKYKSLLESVQHSQYSPFLYAQLARVKEQSQHYRRKYQRMKVLNESMIGSIMQVYSPELGLELQRIMNEEEVDSIHYEDCEEESKMALTQSLCDLFSSHKSRSFRGVDVKNLMTPPRHSHSNRKSLSPIVSKTERGNLSMTPTVASELLCELCEKIYSPIEFFNHLEACKQVSLSKPSEGTGQSLASQSSAQSLNYTEIMTNLLNIRNEIENQIQLLMHSREKIDRASEKKKLERDLAHVLSVIKKKESQLKVKQGKNKNKKVSMKSRC